MGSHAAEGENRAHKAVEGALASPLLKDNEIEGARYILLNISSSTEKEVTMDEVTVITDYIQEEAGLAAEPARASQMPQATAILTHICFFIARLPILKTQILNQPAAPA